MIRGDIRPSNREGEIFIESDSIIKRRAAARQHLGVCPVSPWAQRLKGKPSSILVDEDDTDLFEAIRRHGHHDCSRYELLPHGQKIHSPHFSNPL